MKMLLVFSWLLIGGGGYYGYNFYQQSLQTAQELEEANASKTDLSAKLADLTSRVSALQGKLDSAHKEVAALRLSANISPTAMPTPTTGSVATSLTPSLPTSIPSTITTLLGKTYTGCILSRVTPDGLSFTHSMGVAKVLFSELDPTFAATFGYNPEAAKKYEQEQTLAAAKSDANRATAEVTDTAEAVAHSDSNSQNTTEPRGLSDAERSAIQAQITSLQADVAFMQRDQQKVVQEGNKEVVRADGRSANEGAYQQKIVDEQAQIAQLQAQLR